MITLDKNARCDHGRHPAYCPACLDEWANHFEWQRRIDEEIEAIRLLAETASDREYDEWLDAVAPRVRVAR